MERALSAAEFAILSEYAAIGDRLGYYATLGEWGFEYGTLAQQVVNNEGLSGTAACSLRTEWKRLAIAGR